MTSGQVHTSIQDWESGQQRGPGSAPVKIGIFHPTNWPHVRRGTERFMNELAAYLAQRGHEVTIVCGTPGRPEVVRDRGYLTRYRRSLWRPSLARLGILDYHVFPLTTARALLRERFDVVHCFGFTDALVASWLSRLSGARVILHLTSIPPSVRYRRSVTTGGRLVRRAIHAADLVLTVSQSQQRYFERYGREILAMPVPVDTEAFPLALARNHAQPTIVCASALEDPRKGGRLLMRAFNRLKQTRPAVRLAISSQVGDALREALLALVDERWRRDVRFFGAGELSDLPAMLGSASVVVVPSLWEAFSMVLLEALATGTPVVATRDGGSEEIIRPRVGRTFEPGPPDIAEPSNVEGLAEALAVTLDLSRRPETAHECRARAERFAWSALGPRFEDIYLRVLGRARADRIVEEP
jgi:phosphatidylinositol alpha-mannosyltransferase